MSIRQSVSGILDRPLGRVLVLVLGGCLIYLLVRAYPVTRPVIRWSLPLTLIVWGLSRLYIYSAGDTLTLVAGCLLVVGGITRGLFQFVPMTELAGTVANLVPLVGIFVEMYAHHYRTESG
jgi:hypothetical protein